MPFVVVGTWSGYGGRDKLVHQETILDDSLREKYAAIHSISYTDGTYLTVTVYDRDNPPQKLGYQDLLSRAVAQGKEGHFSVLDVQM